MRIERLDGGITSVPGFLASGVRSGVKSRGLDLALIVSDVGPVPAAGAFTTNSVRAAPVQVTMKHLRRGRKFGAVVINSGCANSFTGEKGLRDARRMAELVAQVLGLRPHEVAVASTGMIGTYLPMTKIESGIRKAAEELSPSREAAAKASKAIMTTDQVPKEVVARVKCGDGTSITIAGMAKGAGMIRPRLRAATMLAFVTTDARVDPTVLRTSLQSAVDKSFNMITVDNETSTNDTVLVLANGMARNEPITHENPDVNFQMGLDFVLTELARMIVKDAEGATRMIEVRVTRARKGDARKAALAVAGSNLLKAAVSGGDPNWGRVIAALGYSGARFNPQRVNLKLESENGRVELVRRGKPVLGGLSTAEGIMRAREVRFEIDLAAGSDSATAWGCDLTCEYVRLNSRYRSS